MPRPVARVPAALWLALALLALAGLPACERRAEPRQVTCAGAKEPLMTTTIPADTPVTVPAIDQTVPVTTETATFALG